MEMQPKLLVAKDIWKQYGIVPVLKGVSLELSKGDLVSIVGPSGAGKSTLLQIICQITEASKGTVTINGRIFPREDVDVWAFRARRSDLHAWI